MNFFDAELKEEQGKYFVELGGNRVELSAEKEARLKANGVKSKFLQGDITGSNNDSAAAKKWVLITVVVGVVWTLIQAYRIISDPSLLQQIQEGTIGSLYSL